MELRKRLMLAALGPALLLGGAEAGLRLAGFGAPGDYFLAGEIGGREVWTENARYGWRHFPPRIARTPPSVAFDRRKKPGTVRIFVLGESAAMGEPMEEFGLARQLELQLGARFPDRRIETVNAAMTAINSHAMAGIAAEAARLEADAIVFYAGNNEVVGPYGPGTVFGPFSGAGMATRARVWATRLRLGQLMKRAGERLGAGGAGGDEWEGLGAFARRPTGADDPALEAARRQFRENVERAIGHARAAGAEAIVCTVATNLRDCPPFAGEAARKRYAEAVELAEAGDGEGAARAFGEARDLDELRARADGGINEILREIGESGGPGTRFVDAEKKFGEAAGGAPGHETFVDHVPCNFAGNHALARMVAEAAAELPALAGGRPGEWPTLEESRDRLLYTVWSELDLAEQMRERFGQPPFAGQPGNAERMRALARRAQALRAAADEADLDGPRRRFEEAMRAAPGDWHIRAGWGAILCDRGEYAEAERHWRAALELAPHSRDLRAGLGLALGLAGKAGEGIRATCGGGGSRGEMEGQYLASIGRTLLGSGKAGEAAEFLGEAARIDPGNAKIRKGLAASRVKLGDLRGAEKELRAALAAREGDAEAAEDLALLLAADGRAEESEEEFRRALARHPDRSETRMKHAVALMGRGEGAAAERELEKAVGLDPGNVDAWRMLERARRMVAGGGGK